MDKTLMKQTATTLNSAHADALIEASAEYIRAFLSFTLAPSADSIFAKSAGWEDALKDLPESIVAEAQTFAQSPEAYSTDALVSYGEFYKEAIHHPVRIEVRRRETGDITQIAARGVIGHFRAIVLKEIEDAQHLSQEDIELRISGHGSFEANMRGVNKALPIRYLTHKLDGVLNLMDYQPGYQIDVRSSRTLIAADGDGTTFATPNLDGAPTVKESETYSALLAYLESGGVYIILSGNKLERTAERMSDGIPLHLKKRIIIVADGGALMGIFDDQGRIKEVEDYVVSGRAALDWKQKRNFLDMIYLGDDGRQSGNDLDAFEETGWDRSILVADLKTNDIIPSLEHRQVGGLTRGTRAVLDQMSMCF